MQLSNKADMPVLGSNFSNLGFDQNQKLKYCYWHNGAIQGLIYAKFDKWQCNNSNINILITICII